MTNLEWKAPPTEPERKRFTVTHWIDQKLFKSGEPVSLEFLQGQVQNAVDNFRSRGPYCDLSFLGVDIEYDTTDYLVELGLAFEYFESPEAFAEREAIYQVRKANYDAWYAKNKEIVEANNRRTQLAKREREVRGAKAQLDRALRDRREVDSHINDLVSKFPELTVDTAEGTE